MNTEQATHTTYHRANTQKFSYTPPQHIVLDNPKGNGPGRTRTPSIPLHEPQSHCSAKL